MFDRELGINEEGEKGVGKMGREKKRRPYMRKCVRKTVWNRILHVLAS